MATRLEIPKILMTSWKLQ